MEILSQEKVLELLEKPTLSRDDFVIDISLVNQAAKYLGVKLPVKVRITSGNQRVGSHRMLKDCHKITVSRNQSLLEINKTLWHELQHAADAQIWKEKYAGTLVSYRSVVTEEKAVRCENTYGFSEWLVRKSS